VQISVLIVYRAYFMTPSSSCDLTGR